MKNTFIAMDGVYAPSRNKIPKVRIFRQVSPPPPENIIVVDVPSVEVEGIIELDINAKEVDKPIEVLVQEKDEIIEEPKQYSFKRGRKGRSKSKK